jgi:hypothetical protein
MHIRIDFDMTNLSRTIFKSLFESEIKLLKNPICQRCDAQIRQPLLPWLVGSRFNALAERILFVGKPHRGKPGEVLPSGMIDPTELVTEDLWNEKWAYWSYTREIATNLFGPKAAEFIALTNVIKCTNVGDRDSGSSSTDKTTFRMAECCIQELGVIWKKVEQLKPTTIIFYTHGLFPEMLKVVPIALADTIRDITPAGHLIPCRNKRLHWWDRTCATPWTSNLRILVIGHPERMARQEYVALVTNWIRPNPL